MGQFWMTSSTTSEMGWVKSGLANWMRIRLSLRSAHFKPRCFFMNTLCNFYLRVEEDLRPQKALVADVDGELLLGDGVDACVLFDPLGAVCVVLVELLHQVGADVAETLLKTQDQERKHETKMRNLGWSSTSFHFQLELNTVMLFVSVAALTSSGPAVLHNTDRGARTQPASSVNCITSLCSYPLSARLKIQEHIGPQHSSCDVTDEAASSKFMNVCTKCLFIYLFTLVYSCNSVFSLSGCLTVSCLKMDSSQNRAARLAVLHPPVGVFIGPMSRNISVFLHSFAQGTSHNVLK